MRGIFGGYKLFSNCYLQAAWQFWDGWPLFCKAAEYCSLIAHLQTRGERTDLSRQAHKPWSAEVINSWDQTGSKSCHMVGGRNSLKPVKGLYTSAH